MDTNLYYSYRWFDSSSSNPFFVSLFNKPRIEITATRDDTRLGFRLIARNRPIQHPRVTCNGIEYILEKDGKKIEKGELMYTDVPYMVYPYGLSFTEVLTDNGYLLVKIHDIQTAKVLHESSISFGKGVTGIAEDLTHSTLINTTITINGLDFTKEDCHKSALRVSGLKVQRDNAILPVPSEKISFTFEEIKKPPFWKRLFRIKQ